LTDFFGCVYRTGLGGVGAVGARKPRPLTVNVSSPINKSVETCHGTSLHSQPSTSNR